MKKQKDIITEEEFTIQMTPASPSPENDSPGDSEDDAGSEFLMGMNYGTNDELEADDEDESLKISNAQDLEMKPVKNRARQIDELPETAKVISSNQPSPWMDLESSSDTN